MSHGGDSRSAEPGACIRLLDIHRARVRVLGDKRRNVRATERVGANPIELDITDLSNLLYVRRAAGRQKETHCTQY
jgi:hypothetical protein